jgi:predicted Zn-ribbon and HTH transcriptional regulator
MIFIETDHCKSRLHCSTCRRDSNWRTLVNAPDICPFNIDINNINKLKNLSKSIIKWSNNKFHIVSNKILNDRLEICKSCEFWDNSGYIGTGKCKKCGCSTWAKLRMATERCPMGKWEAVQATP